MKTTLNNNMEEKILEINKISDSKSDGIEIVTNKQKISFLIDNAQQCCEDFGYFISEDNLEEFIGSKLFDINLISEDNEVRSLFADKFNLDNEDFNGIFINIETSDGTLQFVAYNEHNGYYGHTFTVTSKQLNFSKEV